MKSTVALFLIAVIASDNLQLWSASSFLLPTTSTSTGRRSNDHGISPVLSLPSITNSDSLEDMIVSGTMEELSSTKATATKTTTRKPADTTTTSSSSTTVPSNRQALENDYPQFPRTWVPLASTLELDPTRPNRLEFLGQSYVAYHTNATDFTKGQWVVMDNTCPHRLAPLSEGRVEPTTGQLQCSYHGWSFDKDGKCQEIPQATPSIEQAARQNPRSCVPSYSVMVDPPTGVLWIWPWSQDALSIVGDEWRHPEGMLKDIIAPGCTQKTAKEAGITTYTRDHPYGWDTLVENLIDPAHIPFAHHGMQGTRQDAIPINMTRSDDVTQAGFSFEWEDRTMGMMRTGQAKFRAPFMVHYNATFVKTDTSDDAPPRPFRLTVLCIPTKPGWSRVIVLSIPEGGGHSNLKNQLEKATGEETANGEKAVKELKKAKKKKFSLAATVFKLLPTWMSHLLSSKFFDSDLAFLHYQEQRRRPSSTGTGMDKNNDAMMRGDARYFMPAESDRSIVALHGWLGKYAKSYLQKQATQLPPAIYDRSILFNRYLQHTSQCKICTDALAGLQRWKRRSQYALVASIVLGLRHWPARLLAVACLGVWKVLSKMEGAFYLGEFKHHENH